MKDILPVGINQSHTIGADDTHTVAESHIHHFSFEGRAFLTFLPKSVGDHDKAFHLFLPAFINNTKHLRGRYGDNSQVYLTRYT
jgi:hypothetical protein